MYKFDCAECKEVYIAPASADSVWATRASFLIYLRLKEEDAQCPAENRTNASGIRPRGIAHGLAPPFCAAVAYSLIGRRRKYGIHDNKMHSYAQPWQHYKQSTIGLPNLTWEWSKGLSWDPMVSFSRKNWPLIKHSMLLELPCSLPHIFA